MKQRQLMTIALSVLTLLLGYWVQRSDFYSLLGLYGAFSGLYLWVVFRSAPADHLWYQHTGIFLRVLLLFSIPNLSDDVYRFLWDGRLWAAGYHPFVHIPRYFIENGMEVPGNDQHLFALLNSPDYYTVYPPFAQAAFALAGFIFTKSILGGTFVIKLVLLACEWGSIRLLTKRNAKAGLLYALNPLAIIEVVGNAHFEGAMIFFLLWSLYFLEKNKLRSSAFFWAMAIAAKLLPVLFLPILWKHLGLKKGIQYLCWCLFFSVLLFAPLLHPALLANMSESLNLYFRQFEFNASVYYLLKFVIAPYAPEKMDVARTLGPMLALTTMVSVLFLALKTRTNGAEKDLLKVMSLASLIYLLNATTVHPWYVLAPFALGIGADRRTALAWTFTAIFSYAHYMGGGFQEHYGWIAAEYLGAFLIASILRFRQQSGVPCPEKAH